LYRAEADVELFPPGENGASVSTKGKDKAIEDDPATTEEEREGLLTEILVSSDNSFEPHISPEEMSADEAKMPVIIVGGESHAARLAEAFSDLQQNGVAAKYLPLSGGRLTDQSAQVLAASLTAELATQPAENKEDVIVVLQLYDNDLYRSAGNTDYYSSASEPAPEDDETQPAHILGDLAMLNEENFKKLMQASFPVIRAARGAKIILLGPLYRYIKGKCCQAPGHLTNFSDIRYRSRMAQALRDVESELRAFFALDNCGVKILNPAGPMGEVLIDWGSDPVHPEPSAYRALAEHILTSFVRPGQQQQAGFILRPAGGQWLQNGGFQPPPPSAAIGHSQQQQQQQQ